MSGDVAAVAFHDPRPSGKHIAAGAAEDLRRQSGRRQTGRQLRAVDHQPPRLLPAGQRRRQLCLRYRYTAPNPIRQALTKSLFFILSPLRAFSSIPHPSATAVG